MVHLVVDVLHVGLAVRLGKRGHDRILGLDHLAHVLLVFFALKAVILFDLLLDLNKIALDQLVQISEVVKLVELVRLLLEVLGTDTFTLSLALQILLVDFQLEEGLQYDCKDSDNEEEWRDEVGPGIKLLHLAVVG